MEAIRTYFFRDIGITLGRSMYHILRSRDTMITVTLIIMPIAFMLLFVYVLVGAIQILEELFFSIISKKRKSKWKR